jgi:hypothetical protein
MIEEHPQGLFRSPAHLSDRSQDLFAVVTHMIAHEGEALKHIELARGGVLVQSMAYQFLG